MEATTRRQVYGIDFSGAKDAGKKIWIASGVPAGDTLRIDNCCRAGDLPDSSRRRDQSLTALRNFIAGETKAAFGLDFPFGLPQDLVDEGSWEDFILEFPHRYPDAGAFRQACREAGDGRELKRVTDVESQTPFSPYNLRLFRQTYHGIRDVLYPLVRDDLARVLPMQAPVQDKPWILEVCPASTLKQQGLYLSYKGKSDQHRATRARILEALEGTGVLTIQKQATRSAILEGTGGDALDSVIAAFVTFKVLPDGNSPAVGDNDPYALEGYVYI